MKALALNLALVGWLLMGVATAWGQLRLTTVTLRPVSCAGRADGLIEVQAAGGQGPYEYALDNRGFRFGNRFENLPAGSYRIQARDRVGQTAELRVDVLEPPYLSWNRVEVVPPSRCLRPGTGQLSVEAAGGTPPYQYELSGRGIRSDGQFDGLLPGQYVLRIIDRFDCTRDTTLTLANPIERRSLQFEATPSRCANTPDGAIRIGGDTAGLQFSLNGQDFEARTAWEGLDGPRGWIVFSRDTTGCQRTDNVFVGAPAPLTARLLGQVAARCGGEGGVLRFGAAGGTPPYTYRLANGSDTLTSSDGRFADLSAATYDLIVQDANGCTDLLIVELPEQGDLGLELEVVQPLCLQVRTGQIGGRASAGSGPVQFRLGNSPWQDSLRFVDLDRGRYRLTARDAQGCQQDTFIELAYRNQLVLHIDEVPPTCTEEATFADGRLTVRASGGTAPYTYALNGGAFGADSVFAELGRGGYVVQASDAEGCQTDAVVFLFPFRELRIDYALTAVSCAGDSTGEVRVRVRGGNTGHWFGLHPRSLSESDSIFSQLPAGPFVVYTMDPFGCIDRDTVVVGSPEPLVLDARTTGTSCPGRSDGEALIATTGGRAPVRAVWLATGDTLDVPTRATGLASGWHTVLLIDSAGCRSLDSLEIGEPSLRLDVWPSVCGGADGRIDVQAAGLRQPVEYRLLGAADSIRQPESLFTNLLRGDYVAQALGAESCTLQVSARITGPDPLRIEVRAVAPSSCRTNDGQLHITARGGRWPYAYALDDMGLQSDSVFAFLAPAVYAVRVQDSAGCVARTGAALEQPEARFRLTVVTQEVSCAGGSDGQARVDVREGLPPYTYIWATGDEGPELNRRPAGVYPVAVMDQTGCLRLDTARIGEPTALRLAVRIDTLERAYRLTGRATGGRPPYRYSLNDSLPRPDSVYTPLGEGAYVLTVIDANDCTAERPFELQAVWVGRRSGHQLSVSVYPNPTGGVVDVRTNRSEALPYAVYDAAGRQLESGVWPDGRAAQLDLGPRPAGLYLLRIGEGRRAMQVLVFRVSP